MTLETDELNLKNHQIDTNINVFRAGPKYSEKHTMIDRLIWVLLRRHKLALSDKNFRASRRSYASKNAHFEGYNRIYGHGRVINASIGLFTYIANARVVNCNVGRYCSIGPDALIGGLGRHPTRRLSTHPVFYSQAKQAGETFSKGDYFDEKRSVSIGNDVWIGARAIVLDGVTVGDGVIIAAGAVVTQDVEPYTVVCGIPAKATRRRYSNEIISRLLEMRWWDWPIEALRDVTPLFQSDDETAIEQLMTYGRERGYL